MIGPDGLPIDPTAAPEGEQSWGQAAYGAVTAAGKGLLSGAREDFIAGAAINAMADAFPGVSREDLDAMDQEVRSSRTGDLFRTVGKWGTFLAEGWGAGAAGRLVGRAALGAVAPALAEGAMGGRFAQQAARYMARAEGTGLETVAGVGPERALGGAFAPREALVPIPKPGLERGAEILGQAGGGAVLGGAAAATDPEGRMSPLMGAALGAGLSGAADLGLMGVGNAIRPGGPISTAFAGGSVRDIMRAWKPVDMVKALENVAAARGPEFRSLLKGTLDVNRESLIRHGVQFAEAMGVDGAEDSLRGMAPTRARAYVESIARRAGADIPVEASLSLQGARRASERIGSIKNLMAEMAPATSIIRESPILTTSRGLAVQKFMVNTFKSPEVMAKELGPGIGTRLAQLWSKAEGDSLSGMYHTRATVGALQDRAKRAIGKGYKREIVDYASAYQDGGLAGVQTLAQARGHQGMPEIFGELEQFIGTVLRGDAKRGARGLYDLGLERELGAAELQSLGVRNLLPYAIDHSILMDRGRMKVMIDKLVETSGMSREQAAYVANKTLKEDIQSFGKISGLGLNRKMRGNYSALVADQAPIVQDPFVATAEWGSRASRKIGYASTFGEAGEKGQMAKLIPMLVEKEGGDKQLAQFVSNTIFGIPHYDAHMSKWLSSVMDTQTASKLALSVMTNATQPFNSMLAQGTGNTIRSMMNVLRGSQAEGANVINAADLAESVMLGGRESLLEPGRRTVMGHIADWVLRFSGFNRVERWNRMVGGGAGDMLVRRTLAQAASGRLRGNRLDWARRALGDLDVNLDDTVGRIKAMPGSSGEEKFLAWRSSEHGQRTLQRSAFNAMRQTQFIQPDYSKMPLLWRTPTGRMLTQFKTYALNQGRFFRDQVMAEAARGNYRPLAMYTAAAPVMGEAVTAGKDVFRDPRRRATWGEDPFTRYFDDVLTAGGLGIIADTVVNFGNRRLVDWILGPSIGDMSRVTEALASSDRSKALGKWAGRMPIVQTGETVLGAGAKVMGFGAMKASELSDWLGGEGAEGREMNAQEFWKLQKGAQ